MINLIPNREKNLIMDNLRARFLITLFVSLTVAFFIGAVAFLPAYFFSSIKKEIANNKLDEQRKEPLPRFEQKALSVVQDLNNKFKLLENAEANRFIVTEKVINELVLRKAPEIKLTQISYSADSGRKIITVRGFAPSRESLLAFRFMLENNPSFTDVDLPISNFIKGSNIQFFLTLSPLDQLN